MLARLTKYNGITLSTRCDHCFVRSNQRKTQVWFSHLFHADYTRNKAEISARNKARRRDFSKNDARIVGKSWKASDWLTDVTFPRLKRILAVGFYFRKTNVVVPSTELRNL